MLGRSLFALILTVFALSSCAPIAALRETRVRTVKVEGLTVTIKSAQESLALASKVEKKQPIAALSHCLAAAESSARDLQENPKDKDALKIHNFALDRVFGIIRKHNLDPWSQPLQAGSYKLTNKKDARASWNPALYEFVPNDQLEVGGSYLTKRVTREGLGSSLVVMGKNELREDLKRFSNAPRIYYGITAVARFNKGICTIQFYDPLDMEKVTAHGHEFPLAADFTTPLAVMLTKEKPQKLGLARLLNPGKYADTAQISRMRPYDPERIPVLLVHGLLDTTATWAPMINALRDDPVLRKKYQIWTFSYPSGYPYPYSAALLRNELNEINKAYPGHKPIVYVGHSMGGMIGKLMLQDSGMNLWNTFLSKSPEELDMAPEKKQLLKNILIFDSRDEISRSIFICAPHQGSELASGWIGRMGSRLVKLPSTMIGLADLMKDVLLMDDMEMQARSFPTSIDTLSPTNRFVVAANKLPIKPGVPYHTISGNRGKGIIPDCSDGVVPYWSSHLEGAESELIVPYNHGAHQKPEAINEVIRILKKHAGR
jgi:hypothetical protein